MRDDGFISWDEIMASREPRKEQFVHFNRKELQLEIRYGKHFYWIDLDRASTPGEVLDWLAQIFNKTWVEPDLFYEVFDALNDACREVFGTGIQGCLCPMGGSQGVDWARGRIHENHS